MSDAGQDPPRPVWFRAAVSEKRGPVDDAGQLTWHWHPLPFPPLHILHVGTNAGCTSDSESETGPSASGMV
jgi:hypothetical protein